MCYSYMVTVRGFTDTGAYPGGPRCASVLKKGPWCAASLPLLLGDNSLFFRRPGPPLLHGRPQTTIIKQVSQAQTTVQPSTALQLLPGFRCELGAGWCP